MRKLGHSLRKAFKGFFTNANEHDYENYDNSTTKYENSSVKYDDNNNNSNDAYPPKPKTDEEKLSDLLRSKERVAKLHFYLQDVLGGPNPTVSEVARSTMTADSTTIFGQVRVVDDLMTAGPEKESEKLGRAQGMITFTDLNESALTMNLNFYFTSGQYGGSTICIVGRNPINNKDREFPVVGGTGIFRMSRGYSISNTYSFDATTNYGVLEYTLYVAYLHDVDPTQE